VNELFQAFILGNTAILTNVCVLPLYPGLLAFMAGTGAKRQNRHTARLLGLFVLAGVLGLMLLVGWLLYLFKSTFGIVLPILLPVIYTVVVLLGLLMVSGRNPFSRLGTVKTPVLRNQFGAAFAYGLLLGPMTLPCAGPLVVSVFLLGAGSASGLLDNVFYFLAFGLGFGWPLIVLPLFAQPIQRRFASWTTRHYGLMTRVSGVLLIIIGLYGIIFDVAPNI